MTDTLPVGSREYELAQEAARYLPVSGHPSEQTREVFRRLAPQMLDMALAIEGACKDLHMIYLIAMSALEGRTPLEEPHDYLLRTELGLGALSGILDIQKPRLHPN